MGRTGCGNSNIPQLLCMFLGKNNRCKILCAFQIQLVKVADKYRTAFHNVLVCYLKAGRICYMASPDVQHSSIRKLPCIDRHSQKNHQKRLIQNLRAEIIRPFII